MPAFRVTYSYAGNSEQIFKQHKLYRKGNHYRRMITIIKLFHRRRKKVLFFNVKRLPVLAAIIVTRWEVDFKLMQRTFSLCGILSL